MAVEKLGFCFNEDYIQELFSEQKEVVDSIFSEIDFYETQFRESIVQIEADKSESEKEELYNMVVNAYNPQTEFSRYMMAVQVLAFKEELNNNLIHYLGDNLEYFSVMHETMFYSEDPLKQSNEAIKNIKKMKVSYVFENQPVIEIDLTVRVLHALHILKVIEKGVEAGSNFPFFKIQLLMNYYLRLIPNFSDIEYYKTTLAISNKHRQTINRKNNESELREKALNLFKDGHPSQKRKWKNRTEFKNYFLVTHNSSINDERKWVKDATLNRWIKEFFSSEIQN